MTLRGHTDGIRKVLLTPGGADIVTSKQPVSAPLAIQPQSCSLAFINHEQPLVVPGDSLALCCRLCGWHSQSLGHGESHCLETASVCCMCPVHKILRQRPLCSRKCNGVCEFCRKSGTACCCWRATRLL